MLSRMAKEEESSVINANLVNIIFHLQESLRISQRSSIENIYKVSKLTNN